MSAMELWMLALALAVDCFTVSMATGVVARRVVLPRMTMMALSFGLFQGAMTWIGYSGVMCLNALIQHIDHWIAFGLLTYLGLRMIWEGLHPQGDTGCRVLSCRNILTMSVATSIDALAVGISFACVSEMGHDILQAVGVIALCSFLLSVVGLGLGIGVGRKLNFHAEVAGGLVLIAIGIKILIEHLN